MYLSTKIWWFYLINLSFASSTEASASLGHPGVSQQKKWNLVLDGIRKFWLADQGAAFPMKNFDFGPSWDTVVRNPALVSYLTL
jgi:hypothetical protein